MHSTLKVTEIFYSLQGESSRTGIPTTFIRLTGCPLRCTYCDTTYAFHGGKNISISDILDEISSYKTEYICVTGGEPLAQKNCWELLQILCEQNYRVSIETSGAITIKDIDPSVLIIMDIKTPSSGEANKNLWENITLLKSTDEIKFVIQNKDDYEWVKQIIEEHQLHNKCQLLFSPGYPTLNPTELANWILKDQLSVRLQIQLHKILWGEKPGT